MRYQKAGQKNAGKVLCKSCGLDWNIRETGEVVQVPQRQSQKTWTVTVKDLGTGEQWTVEVETETNRQAAARVRALETMYSGLDWQANLIVTSCMRSEKAA
jgi:hypothetical protein